MEVEDKKKNVDCEDGSFKNLFQLPDKNHGTAIPEAISAFPAKHIMETPSKLEASIEATASQHDYEAAFDQLSSCASSRRKY